MVNYYNKDLYKILDISPFSTESEIKNAYRKAVRVCHPDVAGKNADVSTFKDIQEAYEILSDLKRRKKYDALHGYYTEKLRRDSEERKRREELRREAAMKEAVKNAEKNSNESVPFARSINDALDNLFGKKHFNEKNNTVINGDDISLNISVSPAEALKGTSRKVNILNTAPCPKCEGRKFINTVGCDVCSGVGQISKQKKITVKIPPGVTQGTRIRVKSQGNKGINGGKDGDLYLTVNIEKNSYFDTEGFDIVCTLPVTPFEAVFGAEIPLKFSTSDITVKIPPMTSSGQKFRIKGEGLENKSDGTKGDIIITVQIKLPPDLSFEEKILYSKLSEISNYDIRKDFYES